MGYKEFIKEYLEEYFAILEDFFCNLTKMQVHEFATFDDIAKQIRAFFQDIMMNQKASTDNHLKALNILEDKLSAFYSQNSKRAIQVAKEFNGLRLCIPGNRSFGQAQFDAVKAGLLFSDCILIPDPIFPWLNNERKNDKHRLANILKETFSILQLKPILSGCNGNIPPIWIFPLVEDEFSLSNPAHKNMIETLITDFCNSYLDDKILEYSQVAEYVKENPEKFMKKVEEDKLFIPFGAKLGDPIDRMLIRYKDEVAARKDKKESHAILSLSKPEIILKSISERLQAQLQLIIAINKINSNFLLPLEVQGHYFGLIRNAILRKLFIAKALRKEAFSPLSTIKSQKMIFITNAPIETIMDLRTIPSLSILRRKLANLLEDMNTTEIARVAVRSVNQLSELAQLTFELKTEISSINSRITSFYLKNIDKAPVEIEMDLIPMLVPLALNQVSYVKAGQYFNEKKSDWLLDGIKAESLLGVSLKG